MITLFTWPTPNGQKVQILLEELGEAYAVQPVNIITGEQFEPEYLALNPNNKVPTIVDSNGPEERPFTVFETGAILLYLAEKYRQFLPSRPEARSEVIQWLMWQMGGLGPMLGQAQHFHSYAKEKVPYAINRYTREGRRLLEVMEHRLADREFLVDEYSIADIACFPWVRVHTMANQTIADLPNVSRWYSTIRARPAVDAGLAVLRKDWVSVITSDQAKETLFGDMQYNRKE